MKTKKDIKFIIYQSLYIFVICVIAIKGADLNLDPVDIKKMIDPGWTYVDTTNKVLIDRNEYANLIKFDSTKYLIVSKEDYNNHPEKYSGLTVVNTHTGDYTTPQTLDNTNTEKPIKPDDPKPEIVLGEVTLYQYHTNIVNNKGDLPISIKGVTIPAHSSKSVDIGGDGTVLISSGNTTKTVQINENKKPNVNVQAYVPLSGEEIHVSKLQQVVGYRITITDDFADQLNVKVTGPITSKVVKQTNNEIVIDVTLNAFHSMSEFNRYAENLNQETYRSTFNIDVSDKFAPHKISKIGQFVFTEW